MGSATSKTLVLLGSAGAVVALAWSAQQSHGPVTLAAPPIRAVDEPLPARIRLGVAAELGLVLSGGKFVGGIDVFCSPNPCSSTLSAKANAEVAKVRDAIRPAEGTAPRVIAELPGKALLLAWRDTAHELCFEASRLPAGGGVGVFGPCLPGRPQCGDICVRSSSRGSGDNVLVGTVRGDATALRITRRHGPVTQVPLTGPVVRGTTSRVVMLPLERANWYRLQLLRQDTVIAATRVP